MEFYIKKIQKIVIRFIIVKLMNLIKIFGNKKNKKMLKNHKNNHYNK